VGNLNLKVRRNLRVHPEPVALPKYMLGTFRFEMDGNRVLVEALKQQCHRVKVAVSHLA
jgi:hypothetical protein